MRIIYSLQKFQWRITFFNQAYKRDARRVKKSVSNVTLGILNSCLQRNVAVF